MEYIEFGSFIGSLIIFIIVIIGLCDLNKSRSGRDCW